MKQLFDNPGVDLVQARIVALPAAELATEVNFIRTDFKGWMRENFDLTSSQEQQLDLMPADFATRLANAIADHYEKRTPVQFYKETSDDGKSDDLKDLIIHGQNQLTYTLGSSPGVAVPEFGIWIGYKRSI